MVSPMLRPSSSYDELWRQVDHSTLEIPKRFNLGVACVHRHDPAARALTAVARDRSTTDHTFDEVTELASRFANAPREG
jgi:acetyl-CoA synthetase